MKLRTEWEKKERLLIKWFIKKFNAGSLPQEPFKFKSYSEVIDPSVYFQKIKDDIDRGPAGPRSMYKALFYDLMDLFMFIEEDFKKVHHSRI